MTFPSNIQSGTPAKYLFKLVSDNKEVICDTEPLEWSSGSIKIKRDLEVGGVFISSNSDSLTFVGNGAELLRSLYDVYGLNAKCTLIQYWWKEFDFVTPANGRQYIEFPEQYNIDFNFYQVVKVGSFAFGIKVKAINSSIQTKFDQRQDIDVDLNKLVSIGEVPIVDYQSMKKFINYDATNNTYSSRWFKGDYFTILKLSGTPLTYTSIPINVSYSEYAESSNVRYKTQALSPNLCDALFSAALYDYENMEFWYSLQFKITDAHTAYPYSVKLFELNASGEIITETPIDTFGEEETTVIIEGSTTISIKKGNRLVLCIEVQDYFGIAATMRNSEITITQRASASPARKVEGFPIYEAFERVCQHIFDTQYPFYSEFFGTVDNKYNSIGSKYSSENQLHFAHVQSGLNLRGLALSEMTFPVNFKDLFKTTSAINNLGYGFETISGSTRLRIEEYSHFFQDSEIIFSPPLKSRFNKYDIESQVMIEFAPNNIKSGFDKYEYLQLNGRSEPNTTSQRTTILKTATKFENIAKYRGDTKGILDSLNTPIDTTDTKTDEDIFITKSQRDGANEWKPERAENITIVGNSSLFGEDLLNRYFTPSRMLIRHANKIKSALSKPFFNNTNLTFQTSDKMQSLETNGTLQSGNDQYQIKENGNIPVSSLADPIYLPMKHKVTCQFTMKDFEDLKANLFGWFDFGLDIKGVSIKGYLIDFDMPTGKDEATITIIEKFTA